MRIRFKSRIYEVDKVSYSAFGKIHRFIEVNTANGLFIIDCETKSQVEWLMVTMLTKGYFDASGVDYSNAEFDYEWINYCNNKTEEQNKFWKWINKIEVK